MTRKNTDERTLITKAGSTRQEVALLMGRYEIIIGLPVERIALVNDRGKIEYKSPLAFMMNIKESTE